ncbi:MAG: sulfite exporter TauE/SafE family protein [Ichthyobacteriaceae bacterium]|nr:sulfite exporter TauE/SafE family protein [Ichthyobacteriaceae bacterium]
MDFNVIIWLIFIGIIAGLVSGLVGVGGGIIIVPMLVFVMGLSQLEAQGTSIATMIPPIGLAAAIGYYHEGYINWKYAAVISLTFLIGSYFGSKVALSIDPKYLKKGFGVLMIVIAIKMIMSK